MDVFGKDYYIERLEKADFEYIVIQSWFYGHYGTGSFMDSYGEEIYNDYILKKYDLVDTIDNYDIADEDHFAEFLIYKKKL